VDAARTYDVSLSLESGDESSHAIEDDHDHATATTTGTTTTQTAAAAAAEITEVTACHAHTDTLYCMAGSEEWEVTTDVDAANPPDAISGCHAHGENELYDHDSKVLQYYMLTSTGTVLMAIWKSVFCALAPPLRATASHPRSPRPRLRLPEVMVKPLTVTRTQVSSKSYCPIMTDIANICQALRGCPRTNS
jgi:hypothetical protein